MAVPWVECHVLARVLPEIPCHVPRVGFREAVKDLSAAQVVRSKGEPAQQEGSAAACGKKQEKLGSLQD